MHPQLRALLDRNGVNVGGDLDLRSAQCAELLAALTSVSRSERDATRRLGRYALTGDNLLKMVAGVKARARSRQFSAHHSLSRIRTLRGAARARSVHACRV